MRILVVDDSRIALYALSHLLVRNGHTVREATSGAEGLLCVESSDFDIIIIDYYLGDMNAVDFVTALREPIPVILVSGAPQREDLFSAVVQKPYADAELIEAIRKVLG